MYCVHFGSYHFHRPFTMNDYDILKYMYTLHSHTRAHTHIRVHMYTLHNNLYKLIQCYASNKILYTRIPSTALIKCTITWRKLAVYGAEPVNQHRLTLVH